MKDHFVAQTYLRHFQIPGSDGYINGIRKKNLTFLKKIPISSICYKHDWSTSPYHEESPRVVEEYLNAVEPHWKPSVEKLERGDFDSECKGNIAAYIAFLRAFTPTSVRLGQFGLESFLDDMNKMIENGGPFLKGSELEALQQGIRELGGVKVKVDKNYPKALGIQHLAKGMSRFSSFPWFIIKNDTDIPFITSDNPVCLDYRFNFIANIFTPISPTLAIIMMPCPDPEKLKLPDKWGVTDQRSAVLHYNRLVIKSAEDLVLFHNNFPNSIKHMVKKYRHWRVDVKVTKHPGGYICHQHKVGRIGDSAPTIRSAKGH